MNLSKRVAIVTGSGQGIGREIAMTLAEHGASVVISDINTTSANEVAAEIVARNGESIAITADVTVQEEVASLVDQTVSSFGQIDILVNNAGITRDTLLLRMSSTDWDQVLATNLKGAFLCTQAVVRHMLKQRWGRIINIASVVGLIGNAGQANYAAAKAGLIGLTKTTAREVAARGVTANAIAPGFIDTGMTRKLSDNAKQEFLRQIPLGYAGLPKDVANAVAFLASEEAHYITGHVLNVDGGMVMT
ncbi:MAG: 3-oxoacyl-[acyl-carrier-protein] reductase [Dehalococcoidia bacterium]|nr:MAG: 3-oxoacyl-[acyl-carrier-protein] reductase [Dehalococcoidia bacterium]